VILIRTLSRFAVVASLIWLGCVVFWDLRAHQQMENSDPSRLVISFAALIVIALFLAVILGIVLVPAIGDFVGGFIFSPNEEIEKDPHSGAIAKMAQGDYPGAVAEYRAIFERDPNDTSALSEAVRILCDKMHDPATAAALLENALQNDWPHEQLAFLVNRLVDVTWNHQANAEQARALLLQIIETLPKTRYAANATHRLHEIDRDVLVGRLPVPPGARKPNEASD
jgi:hypothetical protein